jgi:hypothetical protein
MMTASAGAYQVDAQSLKVYTTRVVEDTEDSVRELVRMVQLSALQGLPIFLAHLNSKGMLLAADCAALMILRLQSTKSATHRLFHVRPQLLSSGLVQITDFETENEMVLPSLLQVNGGAPASGRTASSRSPARASCAPPPPPRTRLDTRPQQRRP